MTKVKDPILDGWERTRADNRDRVAVFDSEGKSARTFLEMEERARQFADELERVGPGQVVAVQIGNHPDWPSLFLACLRKGVVVLPLEQTISDEQRQNAFQICRVARLIMLSPPGTTKAMVGRLSQTPFEHSEVSQKRPTISRNDEAIDWQSNPPSLLKLTSGTTAAPRAVRFRSEQLLADCENICQTMGITDHDVNFGVIPISHSYGFSNLLTPLIVRGVSLALSNDRIPRAVIDGLAASRATVFAGMPVFYQSFCEMHEPPPLRELRLCISAGAPLPVEIAQAFREKFRREIHSFYGASECGGICYVRKAQPIPGFVGEAMCGVGLELVDPEVSCSLIRVRSRAVADGYFPVPDEDKLGHGNFVPDDLLEKIAGGYRIVGRSSDLINVAGKKVHPAEVEAEILRCEGVREAVVFGRESERRNQEVAACVVAKGLTEGELLAHCRARLSSWQVPRRIYFVEAIPVNERGKTSRRDLALQYPVSR
jgi:acyl-CoA synthetase (AMP-forming)/AMP-acid ligase II